MTDHNALGPDPFDVITIAPANPAAGANFSVAVNLNSRWQVIYAEFQLVTDANAAARLIKTHGNDGTDDIYLSGPTVDLTASLTGRYHGNVGTGTATDLGAGSRLIFPLNDQFFLNLGDTLRITIDSIQVGDQIQDIRFRVKQWISEE